MFFRKNIFFKNSFILLIGSVAINALSYLFHLIVGRMVSVEIYGEVESLTSLANIISVPALAITMIATRYAAYHKADGDAGASYELLQYLNRKIFKYGLPIFIIAIILSPFIGKFLKMNNSSALILIWIIMLVSFLSSVSLGILAGWQKFLDSNWSGMIGALVKLLAGIFLVKLGLELGGVIGGFVLGTAAAYFFSLFALRFIHKKAATGKIDKINFSGLKAEIIPVFLGNLALIIFGNVDMVLAKHNLLPEAAGEYGALTITSKIILFSTGVIATVLFSMASGEKHKKADTYKILKPALAMTALISGAAIFIYFIFSGFILSIIFGNKYVGSASHLGWFAVSVALFSIINLLFQYLMSIHKNVVAYFMLGLSLFLIAAILYFGKDISAIIDIMIIFQIIAIFFSFYYLFKAKKYA